MNEMDVKICNSKECKNGEKGAKNIWDKWETNKIVDLNSVVSIIALNVNKQVKGRECQAGYKSKTWQCTI